MKPGPRLPPGPARQPAAQPTAPTGGQGAARPCEVRIIGGQWRRHRLPVADRPGLRPTPDRVRETLFNWLGQDLSGWHCLDAFAGSGALGFEAASRGAGRVLMLERDPGLAAGLRRTAARLGATTVEVRCADAIALLPRAEASSFDLLLLDPPFGAGLLAPALAAGARVLGARGLIYAEDASPPAPPPGWRVHRHTRAGAVHAVLLQREGDAGPPT